MLAVPVGTADFETWLAVARSAAASERAGIFGPDSVAWHIDREAAVFLGAGRALLMQLAHPWVAAAIADHSRTLSDPVGRFQRTFNTTLTMVFGTTSQAIAAARRLHRRHAAICGSLPEGAGAFAAGSRYRANDAALCWVNATLAQTAPLAYELVQPPLSAADRERYYAETRLFAALFGIPPDGLPQNWAEFRGYVDGMLGSDIIAVSGAARRIAAELFTGAGTGWRLPRWYWALTARLLPPRLRQDFELPYGPAEQRSAERAVAVLRRFYPLIPARLRYVAPYHEAVARLAGREKPPALTQMLNRFWIGQASMAAGRE